MYEKPEEKPLQPIIDGPQMGSTGIEYLFTAKSFDPNGGMLSYLWDWGDGNISEWKYMHIIPSQNKEHTLLK